MTKTLKITNTRTAKTARRISGGLVAATGMMLGAGNAWAHHPLGGETPATIWHGLLSGLGHPVIGFDHLAFVLGAGILAAMLRRKGTLVAPGFVLGTIGGTLALLGGMALPQAELVITLTVLAVGLVAMLMKPEKTGLGIGVAIAALVAFAGMFHGLAYGEAVLGAEPMPIFAYLAGFAVAQLVIAFGAMMVAGKFLAAPAGSLTRRLPHYAGAMVAGVGLTYLVEMAEAVIFPVV